MCALINHLSRRLSNSEKVSRTQERFTIAVPRAGRYNYFQLLGRVIRPRLRTVSLRLMCTLYTLLRFGRVHGGRVQSEDWGSAPVATILSKGSRAVLLYESNSVSPILSSRQLAHNRPLGLLARAPTRHSKIVSKCKS